MQDALDRATHSARELARRIGVDHHDVLVVLGTGLSGAAELLSDGGDPFPLDTLPFFPQFGGAGHRALGWSVPIGDRRVLVMGGRCHLYEGLGPAERVHPVRTGIAAGCSTVILAAAAGGARGPGDRLDRRGGGPPQPHRAEPSDRTRLRRPGGRLRPGAARHCAGDARSGRVVVAPHPAVYAQVHGPQFETPAEVRMLRSAGADVVGMSMAIETIAARHGGAEVLGLAVVTNMAGVSGTPAEVAAISAIGGEAAPGVASVVRHVVGSLP